MLYVDKPFMIHVQHPRVIPATPILQIRVGNTFKVWNPPNGDHFERVERRLETEVFTEASAY